MTNKEIANTFRDLGALMELHNENPYKIRSYQSAYINLRKLESPLTEMDDKSIEGIKGVGKAISSKIGELLETGQLATLNKYREITPQGIQELLQIKGFGPKKIQVIWKDLGVESVGELLYACNENRLVELKGFGTKTQEDLRQKLEYFLRSRDKFHYASLEKPAEELIASLQVELSDAQIALVGDLRRKSLIADHIELVIGYDESLHTLFEKGLLQLVNPEGSTFLCKTKDDYPVLIYQCAKQDFGSKVFRFTATEEFMKGFLEVAASNDFKGIATEKEVFEKANIPFILPELRESKSSIALAQSGQLPKLISETDIKGVLHVHTTYSDGIHQLKDMVGYAKELGYAYIGITDHSQAAFYAGGLKVDQLQKQWAEIDALNATFSDFKIFKGIESDILNDGRLDYEDDILKQFDFIIASVHSNLKMDKDKATQRLLTAIENPYTTILGHPTGRLLLSREGYPIDHQKVIDACAANGVVIELNANPYRLDLDWKWIPYALEKGCQIAINPDAHSKGGIHDIHYGVLAARKGMLTKENCLNCLDVEEFEQKCA